MDLVCRKATKKSQTLFPLSRMAEILPHISSPLNVYLGQQLRNGTLEHM